MNRQNHIFNMDYNNDKANDLEKLLHKMEALSPDVADLIHENKELFANLVFDQFVLKTLLDNIPDAIYFKDVESRFVKVSKNMVALFNLNNYDELLGKTDFDFQDAKHANEAFLDEQNIIKTGKGMVNFIESENVPYGTRWVSSTKLPVIGYNKEIIGVFGISREITELVQTKNELKTANEELTATEEELRQNIEELQSVQDELFRQKEELAKKNALILNQNKKLEQNSLNLEKTVLQRTKDLIAAKNRAEESDQLKTTFLANMSHEFRTPLNAIIGFSELLLNLVSAPIPVRYIDSIKSSSKNLLVLINEIIDFSRLEVGKLEVNYELVPTYSFFEGIETIFKKALSESNLKYELNLQDNMPKAIVFDEIRLKQIMINLVDNAIKFTPQGFVKIEVGFVINKVNNIKNELVDLIISVSDSGIGMSSELQNNAFESFIQLDAKSDKKYQGVGLGLTITKRLVELFNGTITVESAIDIGTSVNIVLPNVETSDSYKEQIVANTVNFRNIIFDSATILVVNDEDFNKDYLQGILYETNVTLVFVPTNTNIINLVCEINPKLIFVDIQAHIEEGIQFVKEIKKIPEICNIPIIAISAFEPKKEQRKIIESGFSIFLVKPFEIFAFYNVLIKFLTYSFKVEPADEIVGISEELIEVQLSKENICELLKKLEGEMMTLWLGFKKQQPMDEVEGFADLLQQLNSKYPEVNLKQYSTKLKEAVIEFDIINLLRYIEEYPKLIATIRQLV